MPKSQNKTQVPRGYLSPSSISLLQKNEKHWIEYYIYGKKRDFEGFKLGKFISEVFDGKRKDVDAELMRDCVPNYPKREFEITCTLKRKSTSLILLGKLDGWNPKEVVQGEYKTDTKMWTEERAKNLLQLRIYSLIHYKNTGKIPMQELTWIGTKRSSSGKMKLTGEYRTYRIQHSLTTILETQAEVWKAHDRIIKLVEQEMLKI